MDRRSFIKATVAAIGAAATVGLPSTIHYGGPAGGEMSATEVLNRQEEFMRQVVAAQAKILDDRIIKEMYGCVGLT